MHHTPKLKAIPSVIVPYKTFRFEREASSLGIDPESLLLFNRLIKQFQRENGLYGDKRNQVPLLNHSKFAILQESE